MQEKVVKELVRERYGRAALSASQGKSSCCSAGDASCAADPITGNLYEAGELGGLPEEAIRASLGCGNPTALAELKPGEVVLDLGSGGGIDVLLSAKRVGPTGKAYGLDMTDEMLELARENQRKAGVENVEFLKGEIEQIPLPDSSVDVIISNCVINLSADKDRVLREAFRVLKPGGRFAVSDVVVRGGVAPAIRRHMELWAGCIAGALEEQEYIGKLKAAGFEAIEIEPTRVYRAADAREFLAGSGLPDIDKVAEQVDGQFFSGFIRAVKPEAANRPEEIRGSVKTIQVFDPAMCCSTGVCGPAPDPALPRFAADCQWLASQGVRVERFNLAQEPQAFASNDVVKAALQSDGPECLPLILADGVIVSRGRYPEREELARFAGLADEPAASLYSAAVAELVAIGAAVASNCEPCLKYHIDQARKLGVSKADMARAVQTAQAVKENPAHAILSLADRLLRPHQSTQSLSGLPVVESACCAPGISAEN